MGFLDTLGKVFGAVAAPFTLIGDAVGNIMSNNSTKQTNEANLQINKMNNEFAANEAEKVRQFTVDMWNKQNEYNSPAAQAERRAAAGLNPYMDIDSGLSGPVGTSMASPSSAAAQQPMDWRSLGSSFGNAIQLGMSALQTNAGVQQLQGSKAVADAQALQLLSEVDWGKLTPQYRQLLHDTGIMRFNLGIDSDRAQLDNLRWTSKLYEAQRTGMLLDNDSKRILNRYLDDAQQLQLDIEAQRLANMVLEGRMTRKQIQNIIADTIRIKAVAKGQKISNSIAQKTASSYVDALNAQYANENEYYKGLLPYSGSFGQYDYKSRQSSSGMSVFEYENRNWDRWIRNASTIGNGVGSLIDRAANFRRAKPGTTTINRYNNTYYR